MPLVPAGRPVCTVVVTVDTTADVIGDLVEHARSGLDRFTDYDGFIGGALHISDDETRLVQYLQWASEKAYVECRDDPKWNEIATTARFADHVVAGRARVDARTYSVVAHSD